MVAFDFEVLEVEYNRKYYDILTVLKNLESDEMTSWMLDWKNIRKFVNSAVDIDNPNIGARVKPRNESIRRIISILKQVEHFTDEYNHIAQCRMCGSNVKSIISGYERLSVEYIRLYQTVEPNIVR
jgi:hypothetical protein